MEKMAWDGPKWGQEDFLLLIQTLSTFWAERIWILRSFLFFLLFGSQISGFPGPQISKFPDQGLGRLGPAGAPSATPPPQLRDTSATPPDHKVGEIQGTRTIP